MFSIDAQSRQEFGIGGRGFFYSLALGSLMSSPIAWRSAERGRRRSQLCRIESEKVTEVTVTCIALGRRRMPFQMGG